MINKERIDEWEEKIKKVICKYTDLSEKCSAAEAAGVLNPEGKLFTSIWSNFDTMLGIIDPHDWISWYIFDNDCGDKEMEAGHDGVVNKITTPRQLANLIVETEDRYPNQTTEP